VIFASAADVFGLCSFLYSPSCALPSAGISRSHLSGGCRFPLHFFVGAVFFFWCISCHLPGLRFSLLQAAQAGTSLRAWIQRPQGTS
jgi:hypothetical protein